MSAAPDHILDGQWRNERGSVLELRVHDDGRITGTFRLGSDGSCYRPYRVTGTYTLRPEGGRGVVGSLIDWPRANSVTVWTGELDPAGDQLRTRWLMTTGPLVAAEEALLVGGHDFRRSARTRSMRRAG
ncbi:MAG TPA: avidin/streptavidin family protein [Acidimicrobiales bacterium]|nr:avidin/streptavidin family protein [Acidimicrobiales bacterium]